MKFRLFFIGLSFFSFVLLQAQSHPKDEWGNVSPEELKMTVYEPDTSAGAVVLLDKGEIALDFTREKPEVVFMHYRRIKILKPSGYDWADVIIPYLKNKGRGERSIILKAQLITPEGEVIPVKKSKIYTQKIEGILYEKRFSYPNVKAGVVLEYYYKLSSKDFENLHRWDFQTSIPVARSELTVAIPSYMEYLMLYQGAGTPHKEVSRKEKRMYFIEARGELPELEINRSVVMKKFELIYYTFSLDSVPALEYEPFITTVADYVARLRFQWTSLYNLIDGHIYHLITTWEDVNSIMSDYELFQKDSLEHFYPDEMEQALEEPLRKAQTARDTLLAVEDYLQREITQVGLHWSLSDATPEEVFEEKRTSPAKLNALFIGALRYLGFEAWPVLISTRSNGKVYKEYPFVGQFNHAVALVKLGRDSVFVDLSTSFHPPGYLPVDMLNRYGYLIDEEGGRWVDIPAPRSEEIFIGDFYIDEETLDLYGSLDCHFRGYAAFDQLKAVLKESDPEAYWARWLQSKYPDAEIDSVAFEEPERFAERMSVRFYVRFPEMVEELGDMWSVPFISPAELDENPLRAEESKVDISLAYPFKEKTIMDLHLPEGMEIVSVPESVKINLPNRGGRALCIVTAGGGKIKRMETLQVNQTEFTPEEYGSLRDFFSLYFERDAEPILLR